MRHDPRGIILEHREQCHHIVAVRSRQNHFIGGDYSEIHRSRAHHLHRRSAGSPWQDFNVQSVPRVRSGIETAEFRFFSSTARKLDTPGTLIDDFGDELEELSPVSVRLESPGAAGELVAVSLETVITETGMLQLWCVARDGRRWKLEFNVREK